MASLGCIDWVLLSEGQVAAGDVVSTDAGGMPIYRVVGVEDGLALLQDDLHPAIQKMPLARLRWKAAQARP